MARPAAVERGLFYPTPAAVLTHLLRVAVPAPGAVGKAPRLLDPCAGTGIAANVLARGWACVPYGIELQRERAAAAKELLDGRVWRTDGLRVRATHGGWQILFLNPPYDWDAEGGLGARLEFSFLTSLTRTLQPGGLLLFVVKQELLATCARFLASRYERFTVWRFPDPEFALFRQVVLLGVLREKPVRDLAQEERLLEWGDEDRTPLPPLDAAAVDEALTPAGLRYPYVPYRIPAPREPAAPTLQPLVFDAEAAAEEARARGAWASGALVDALWPPLSRPMRPLMPLRLGHLAGLAAAGFVDNMVLHDAGGRPALVKGRTYKEPVEQPSDDPSVEIVREVLRTEITLLELDTGRLVKVDTGKKER
jgi:hypothetical protein